MPPSPAMRISPGREPRAENHKRGRSLESGFRFREKDDDLALFNEVQNKERENFLLQSNDDFDDIFCKALHSIVCLQFSFAYIFSISGLCSACFSVSLRSLVDRCRYISFMTATKLRYFSDHKLGISVPARGESSDLLKAEGDKNDYDWLASLLMNLFFLLFWKL